MSSGKIAAEYIEKVMVEAAGAALVYGSDTGNENLVYFASGFMAALVKIELLFEGHDPSDFEECLAEIIAGEAITELHFGA